MKAYSIDPEKREIKEIDIDMQPNSVYSFFNSTSIDEINTLENHTIHSDASAVSNNSIAYYIGNQLVVGDALIVGKQGIQEVDASIHIDELKEIVNYKVSDFYKNTLKLLGTSDINLYKLFEIKKEDEEVIQLNTEWVIYVFSVADVKTQKYFLYALQKAVDEKSNMLQHIQKMAVLALQAGA